MLNKIKVIVIIGILFHFMLSEISWIDNTLQHWIPIRRIEFTDHYVKKEVPEKIATFFQNKFFLKPFVNRVQRTEFWKEIHAHVFSDVTPRKRLFMKEHTVTDRFNRILVRHKECIFFGWWVTIEVSSPFVIV